MAAVAYAGFSLWQKRNPAPLPAAPPPTPIPVRVAVSTPAPRKHLAPVGIYFLAERISVTTDFGVTGIAPGTEVKLLKAGTPMRVTDGREQFDVMPSQVTNDLDIAAQVANADQVTQSSIGAMKEQEEQSYEKQQEAQEEAFTERMNQQPTVRGQALPMDTGELNQPARLVNQPDWYDKAGNAHYRSTIH